MPDSGSDSIPAPSCNLAWVGVLEKGIGEGLGNSETGRIRFRRVQFQTPSSVSFFLALAEFRGESSVSSSLHIICVPKRTRQVFSQNSPSFQGKTKGQQLKGKIVS